MNAAGAVNRTINAVTKEPLLILGASVLTMVLSSVTLSILFPVMWAGMGIVFLKIDRGERPEIKDLFIHLDKVLFLAVQGIIIFLGWALGLIMLILPLFMVMALWIYAPFFLAYRDMTIFKSLNASASAAFNNDFLLHITIVLILILINIAGASLAGVGSIITMPLTCGYIVFLYDDLEKTHLIPD